MRIIYGPVPSWRLGRSLGVDAVSTRGKTCSFDCIYCQLGRTKHPMTKRHIFADARELSAELATLEGVPLNYVTHPGRDLKGHPPISGGI